MKLMICVTLSYIMSLFKVLFSVKIFFSVVCYNLSNLLHDEISINKQLITPLFGIKDYWINKWVSLFNVAQHIPIRTFSLFLSFSALLCVWAELPAPVIKLNSSPLGQSEVVWSADKPFILSCDGQADIIWKTRLRKYQKHVLQKTLNVKKPTTEYTGTYRCSYKNQKDLYSEIHIYVKGMCTIKHLERLSKGQF